jgi:hypothetical protein
MPDLTTMKNNDEKSLYHLEYPNHNEDRNQPQAVQVDNSDWMIV